MTTKPPIIGDCCAAEQIERFMYLIIQDTTWLIKPVWRRNWQQLNDSLHAVVMGKCIATVVGDGIGRVVLQLDDI